MVGDADDTLARAVKVHLEMVDCLAADGLPVSGRLAPSIAALRAVLPDDALAPVGGGVHAMRCERCGARGPEELTMSAEQDAIRAEHPLYNKGHVNA